MGIKILSKKCPNCGSNLEEESNICKYCGSHIIIDRENNTGSITGVICPNCAEINGEKEIYCRNCNIRIRIRCKNCEKLILNKDMICPFCGKFNYSIKSEKKSDSNYEFNKAIKFSNSGNYVAANKIFEKIENWNQINPTFYIEWIRNTMKWAMTFDENITQHSFSKLYRNKAIELYKILSTKFPNHPENKIILKLIEDNKSIKIKKKDGCFIASTIYGDPYCEEVVLLRAWREKYLRNKIMGKLIIYLYNLFGPYIARFVDRNKSFKKIFKLIFNKILKLN